MTRNKLHQSLKGRANKTKDNVAHKKKRNEMDLDVDKDEEIG